MDSLPVLSGDEARSIDLEVTDKVGRIRILETVALRISDLLHYHLTSAGNKYDTALLFIVGKGNNGANALAAARILKLRGFTNIECVTTFTLLTSEKSTASPTPLRPNIQEQIDLFHHFVGKDRLHPQDWSRIERHTGIIVDGILGTGITAPPRGAAGEAIVAIRKSAGKTMAIDVPSGLNHITGEAPDPGRVVKATWTCNLHMFKSGQLESVARPYIGELWSVESGLGFVTFPETTKFQEFYRTGPIRKVNFK